MRALLMAAAGISLLLGLSACHRKFQPTPEPDTVYAEPIALDPERPGRVTYDDLRLVSAVRLVGRGSWTAERFGGHSEIIVRGDQVQLISDVADRFFLPLSVFEGRVRKAPFSYAHLDSGLGDGPGPGEKADNDSEDAALASDGTLYVAYEQVHRIVRYRPGLPPERLNLTGLPRMDVNRGMEGLSLSADERALFVATEVGDFLWCPLTRPQIACAPLEGPRLPVGYMMTSVDRLQRPEGFADLPGADLFFATYRSLDLSGWGMKVALLAVKAGRVERWTLARLHAPLRIDNMEGISVVSKGAGKGWRLYVVSDDNFLNVQNTVALSFDLDEARLRARLKTAPDRRPQPLF